MFSSFIPPPVGESFLWLMLMKLLSLKTTQMVFKDSKSLFENFRQKSQVHSHTSQALVAHSSSGIAINQCKHALDILSETSMLDCLPIETLIDHNAKLLSGQGVIERPWKILTIYGQTQLSYKYIIFAVSIVSQFLNTPCDSHWDAVIRILRYINAPRR